MRYEEGVNVIDSDNILLFARDGDEENWFDCVTDDDGAT
jgi:hypothetical protein